MKAAARRARWWRVWGEEKGKGSGVELGGGETEAGHLYIGPGGGHWR
jgi:hypothetical protein